MSFLYFFLNNTATTEISTLSLRDALPISRQTRRTVATTTHDDRTAAVPTSAPADVVPAQQQGRMTHRQILSALSGMLLAIDRKSTRLNSSHANISYAVFCLKKKNNLYHTS